MNGRRRRCEVAFAAPSGNTKGNGKWAFWRVEGGCAGFFCPVVVRRAERGKRRERGRPAMEDREREGERTSGSGSGSMGPGHVLLFLAVMPIHAFYSHHCGGSWSCARHHWQRLGPPIRALAVLFLPTHTLTRNRERLSHLLPLVPLAQQTE